VFYSKDLIIEFLYISELSIFLLLIILIYLSLTMIYSLRLFFYLFFTKSINFISAGILNKSKFINIYIYTYTYMHTCFAWSIVIAIGAGNRNIRFHVHG